MSTLYKKTVDYASTFYAFILLNFNATTKFDSTMMGLDVLSLIVNSD